MEVFAYKYQADKAKKVRKGIDMSMFWKHNRTDRQTDRQKDRQTDRQTGITVTVFLATANLIEAIIKPLSAGKSVYIH